MANFFSQFIQFKTLLLSRDEAFLDKTSITAILDFVKILRTLRKNLFFSDYINIITENVKELLIMLFKVIDPDLILSDTFKQLPLETKVTYIIVCAIANNQTGEFFHKTKTIADHANLSIRAVQRSLKRLEEAGVIILKGKKSKDSKLYVYCFTVKVREFISKKIASATPQSQVNDSPVVNKRLPSRSKSDNYEPQTLVNKEFVSSDSIPNNLNINDMELTTTFGNRLISELIKEYGKERVTQNAVAVLKLDGKVKNKGAYLRASLRDNYIPTSHRQIEEGQAQARRMEYEKKIEQESLEWKRHVEQINEEANNPEIQAKIKAELEKFMNKLGAGD